MKSLIRFLQIVLVIIGLDLMRKYLILSDTLFGDVIFIALQTVVAYGMFSYFRRKERPRESVADSTQK